MKSEPTGRRVLTAAVCGAGPASDVSNLVQLAQERGWRVGIIATPAALPFLDVPKLEALTGDQVRSEYRAPGEGGARSLPDAEAIVVAPATYNTICKLALGISDTYALGTLAEAVGRGIRVAVLPFVNSALAGRRPFMQAVEVLRSEGVRVLSAADGWTPHAPGAGDEHVASFPWAAALDAAGVVATTAEKPTGQAADPRRPGGVPTYATGTEPDNLWTTWQLGRQGLTPGGPPRGWLLLQNGGMPLYDLNEAKARGS